MMTPQEQRWYRHAANLRNELAQARKQNERMRALIQELSNVAEADVRARQRIQLAIQEWRNHG